MSHKTHEPESTDEDTQQEYDFTGRTGVRGKYYQKLREGYTIEVQRKDGTILVQHITRPEGTVVLDADVREYFPDAESVNTALRTLIHLVPQKKARHRRAAEATAAQPS